MALVIPISSVNAYVGVGKETTSGTAVAPTIFPRWLDGSSLEINLKSQKIFEGSGTRQFSQVLKNQQYTKVKLVFLPRPIELGFFETAAMGISADVLTTAAVNTTLSASASAGATTVTLTSTTGLPVSGTIALDISAASGYIPGTDTEEVVLFTLPAVGSVLTVAPGYNGGKLKIAHSSGATIVSSSQHVITQQTDGNYYTVEVGIGSLNGGAGPTLRVRDCKVDTVKRSSKAGQYLEYEVDFIGIAWIVQGGASTVTLEAHNAFLYTTGSWVLDGSSTGDAPYIETFDITQKNGLDDTIQSELFTLDATIFGQLDVELTATAVFTSPSRLYNIYFGGASGTTDSQTVGAGSLSLTFTQADQFNVLNYLIPTLHYDKGTWPAPKADGKHYALPFTGTAVSNQGINASVLQVSINNASNATY